MVTTKRNNINSLEIFINTCKDIFTYGNKNEHTKTFF